MRAILIEPTDRMISEANLPEFTSGIVRQIGGAELLCIGTLPSGDGVYVTPSEDTVNFFSIGGSGPHYGVGLVIGKRGAFGVLKSAMTDFEALASIVTFRPAPSGRYVIERSDGLRLNMPDASDEGDAE